MRIFFGDLSGILSYFFRSPQRVSALGRVRDRKIPTPFTTRRNFKSRTVATFYENQDKVIECCNELETLLSKETCTALSKPLQQRFPTLSLYSDGPVIFCKKIHGPVAKFTSVKQR